MSPRDKVLGVSDEGTICIRRLRRLGDAHVASQPGIRVSDQGKPAPGGRAAWGTPVSPPS